MNKQVTKLISSINPRQLTNNTQRVLLALLNSSDWVARTSVRVPNLGSRIRELRTKRFGQFRVECSTAGSLGRKTAKPRQTFYRLDPNSITMDRLNRVFEGVVAA